MYKRYIEEKGENKTQVFGITITYLTPTNESSSTWVIVGLSKNLRNWKGDDKVLMWEVK